MAEARGESEVLQREFRSIGDNGRRPGDYVFGRSITFLFLRLKAIVWWG
jgi:hypothetical protein